MGALGLTDSIVSGELPLMITGFKSNADLAKSRGAPVAWVPMELVATNAGGAAVLATAPRPHAALLFVDFLISPEGQKIMSEQFGYGSASKDYGFKKWYPEHGLSHRQYEELTERWQKHLVELTRK
jgi:iron(III) transport system substrate-binding protein